MISLGHRNLCVGQAAQFVYKRINLAVRGRDLALHDGLRMGDLLRSQLLVQVQHARHQDHHLVMASHVGRIGEVNGAAGIASTRMDARPPRPSTRDFDS